MNARSTTEPAPRGRRRPLADRVIALVENARRGVAAIANVAQVYTNYEIGRQIVEEEQGGKRRADYGKRIIKDLSSKLTARFGRGWSFRTLETMRKFYILYAPIPQKAFAESGNGDDFPDMGKGIPQTPFAEFGDVGSANGVWQADGTKTANTVCQVPKFSLSWSHYLLLMRIADPVERAFYEREAADRHWSFRRLERMYRTSTFERRPQAHRRRGKAQVRNGEAARPRREIRKSPRVGAARGANVVRAVCACRDAGESPRMSASRLADLPTRRLGPSRQVDRSPSRHRSRRCAPRPFQSARAGQKPSANLLHICSIRPLPVRGSFLPRARAPARNTLRTPPPPPTPS